MFALSYTIACSYAKLSGNKSLDFLGKLFMLVAGQQMKFKLTNLAIREYYRQCEHTADLYALKLQNNFQIIRSSRMLIT